MLSSMETSSRPTNVGNKDYCVDEVLGHQSKKNISSSTSSFTRGDDIRNMISMLELGESDLRSLDIDLNNRNKIRSYMRRTAYRARRRKKIRSLISDIRGALECPIGLQPIEKPVILNDGYTYEKSNITKWMKNGAATSPITRVPIHSERIIENRALSQVAESWFKIQALL